MTSDVPLSELLRRVKAKRRVIIGRDLDGSAHLAAGKWLARQIRNDIAAMPRAHLYRINCRVPPNRQPSLISIECWAFRE